jgi:hypothetical protein
MSKSRMALAACAALLIAAPAADAAGGKKEGTPADPQAKHFIKKISVERMTAHQQDLQDIADANGGNRAALNEEGTIGSGYQASVDYVVDELESYGYDAKINMFNHPFWEETAPALLQLNGSPAPYTPGSAADDGSPDVDFITMANSEAINLQDVPIVPIDVVDPPVGGSTSGCQQADYDAAPDLTGKVALIQRGECPFVDKWALAEENGAVGVIIYNEGNTPARQNPIFVDNGIDTEIAAVITSYSVGNELLQAYKSGANPTVDFVVNARFTDRFLPQVLAETKQGDKNNVVVVGAHLDSVPAGPGINDDGSGTAMLLTMADELSQQRYKLKQKIRFMWFGAEEDGLVGSQYYAHSLSDAEVAKIDAMLDYDMLASPNYARFVYDGDGSEPGNDEFKGPEGSGFIEQLHDDWFDAQGQFNERIPFDGRSDYVGFTDEGIPAGGIFSGAEVPKTEEQEAIYGGDAGSAYDPCYHEACDSTATVFSGIPPLDAGGLDGATDAERAANAQKMAGLALKSYDEMSDAASYTTWYLATQDTPFSDAPAGKKKGKHKAGKRLHARPLHKRSR